MKPLIVKYERTFNLGNYENERIAVEAQVENGEDAVAAFTAAKQFVLEAHHSKQPAQPKPEPRVSEPAATDKQRSYLEYVLRELGWDSERLAAFARERQLDLLTLTSRQASRLIDDLKSVLDGRPATPDEIPF